MNMFTRNEQLGHSSVLAVATVVACILLAGLGQSPAYGQTNEKGPRCSDGIDNDGDGLIDCDDPDCKCGGDDGGGDKVIATFRDCVEDSAPAFDVDPIDDSDVCPLDDAGLSQDDRIYSDGLGAYIGGKDQQIYKNSFFLSPSEDNDRWIVLDFAECVDGGLCGGLLGQIVSTGAPTYVLARTTTKQDDLLRMPVYPADGSSIPVTFRITFRDDLDQVWFLRFTPDVENCGDSTYAWVTRTREDTWVFEAGPNDKACLLEHTGLRTPRIFHGLYHMPFLLVVVNVK